MSEAVESIDVGQDPPAPSAPGSENFTGANEEAVLESLRSGLERSEPAEQGEEVSGEPVEQQEAGEEEQGAETGDNWLPTEQEKEFPLETLQRFGQRYGYKADEIAGDKRLQLQLKDQINSAILLRPDEPQSEDGLTSDFDDQPIFESEVEPQRQEQPPDTQAVYQQRLEQLVGTIQPEATRQLGMNLVTAFMGGQDPVKQLEQVQQTLRNPNLKPEQRAQLQANAQDLKTTIDHAPQIGSVLARGAVDLVATVLPSILPEVIEQIFPGTAMRYEVGLAAEAWSTVKDAKANGKPLYGSLPAYRTPEFQSLMRGTEKRLGLPRDGLAQMYPGLPKQEQFSRVFRLVAQFASGQKLNPATVAQAVETGKRIATEATGRREQGRVLGAGRGAGRVETSDDPLRDSLKGAITSYNNDVNPTAAMRRAGG